MLVMTIYAALGFVVAFKYNGANFTLKCNFIANTIIQGNLSVKKPLVLISVIVAIGLGFAISLVWYKPKPIELQSLTWLGRQAIPLPVFELTDHNLKPFSNETIKGKWHLIFFGYTNCPDICPESLQILANTVTLLEDESVTEQLQVTFISVDPERDDLEKMKTYVTYFNQDFLSATAGLDEVNKLTDAVGILHYISKTGATDNYEVAHSGSLILTDTNGKFTGVFSSPHDSQKIAHDLTAIIKG
jgi:protein SCO1/2